MDSLKALLDEAARPYRAAGRYAWNFAKGKLRHDPVFGALLRKGVLPDSGNLIDVGCGQGVLLALIKAARERHAAGRWPADWPAPPTQLALRGVDVDPTRVQLARRALDGSAQIEHADLRDFAFPACSAIVMLDVLLYLAEDEQERVLERAAAALRPGGLLLMREADAAAGLAFHMTRLSAWFDAIVRGKALQPLYFRSVARWVDALTRCGLAVDTTPMSDGTPFSNVLFVARKLV